MTEANRLLLTILESLDQGSPAASIHIAKLRAHLEAEGAPVPTIPIDQPAAPPTTWENAQKQPLDLPNPAREQRDREVRLATESAPPTSGAGEDGYGEFGATLPDGRKLKSSWCTSGPGAAACDFCDETNLYCCKPEGFGVCEKHAVECKIFEDPQPAPQPSGNPGELPPKGPGQRQCGEIGSPHLQVCHLPPGHKEPCVFLPMAEPHRDGADERFWKDTADQRGDAVGELSGKLAIAEKYSALHKALAKRYRYQRECWRKLHGERSIDVTKLLADLKRAAPVQAEPQEPHLTLHDHIRLAINRTSAENASNTPDYILAEYLMGCLAAFNDATNARTEQAQPAPVDVIRGSDGERRLAAGWVRLKVPGKMPSRMLRGGSAYDWECDDGGQRECSEPPIYGHWDSARGACEVHAVESGVFAEAPPQVGAGETKGGISEA